ncbi:MAG: hypothetical protein M0Q49_00045 [Porticoccaceae bacterium]|nr:hypothetical protein [Porticoccaceae bacterium]
MAAARRWPLQAWCALLLLAALYCVWRVAGGGAFESNILGLIPQTATGPNFSRLVADRFDKQFVILVSHPEADKALALATELQHQLAEQPGVSMALPHGDPLTELSDFFAPYRHQLLSPEMRSALQKGDAAALADELLRELHSPVPAPRLYSVAEDPFNLGGKWLQSLLGNTGHFGMSGGFPSLRNNGYSWLLLRGTLESSPFTATAQSAVADTVAAFASHDPQARLLRSGLVFHAAEATRLARFEISLIGSGSLLGILLLVIAVFRSRQALVAIAVILVSATVAALAVSLAVFDRVHLVTLAFGSTLLGLAVDYCFHFLIKHQSTGSSRTAWRLVRRGVLLSAGSSIAAYLIQLWSPFPGLHQFAVFMVAGLLSACAATAVLSLNYQAPASPTFAVWRHFYPRYFAAVYQRLAARRWPWLVALVIGVPALALWVAGQGGRDDIRLLNTSSAALLADEHQIQGLLGGIDSQRYWTVAGEDRQQVLSRMERLVDLLNQGHSPSPVMATVQMVPSLERQRRDRALVANVLYGPEGALASLCARLASDCQEWRPLTNGFPTNEASEDALTPDQVPAAVAALFPPLHLGDHQQGLVLVRHGTEIPASLYSAAADLPGVSAVDLITDVSTTLALLRTEVTALLTIFIALFALACPLLFGRHGVVVAVSVLVSLAASLALSASGGVTLFHVLALLLVLGLSVDTAVFYLELGLNGDTWVAATLAMATSILAFGLLSLSQVPVLHHFGSVVFAGLLCSWLVTPLLFHLWGLALPTGRQP